MTTDTRNQALRDAALQVDHYTLVITSAVRHADPSHLRGVCDALREMRALAMQEPASDLPKDWLDKAGEQIDAEIAQWSPGLRESFESHTPASEPAPASADRCASCEQLRSTCRALAAACSARAAERDAAEDKDLSNMVESAERKDRLCDALGWASSVDRSWDDIISRVREMRLTFRARASCRCGELRDGGWQTIDSAPKDTKVLAAYKNELGNWRIVTACFHTQLEWSDEYGDREEEYAPADWYEENDSSETIYPTAGNPTHWRPLPAPPAALTPSPEGDRK